MTKKNYKLSFPEPKFGILECLWTVQAANESEAMQKFWEHLIRLKRQFSDPPQPIAQSNDPAVVGNEFFRRLVQITDPISFVVTLHLFAEHWLNCILQKFCPNRDLTRYDFFKKLEIVYCIEKIPKNLFHNLCKLNDLRVAVSHKPNYDLTKMDLNYLDCPEGFNLREYQPSYAPDAEQHHIFNVLGGVMRVTYFELHNHCVNQLGFKGEKLKDTLKDVTPEQGSSQ